MRRRGGWRGGFSRSDDDDVGGVGVGGGGVGVGRLTVAWLELSTGVGNSWGVVSRGS
jgi:hypothetical protein